MAGSAEPLACPGRCAGPAGTDTVDIGTMPDAVFPRTTFSADSASARGTPGRALLRSCLGSASYRGPLDHVLQLVVVRVEQGFDPGGLRATLACSETCESVGTAAQWCSLIFPITRKRGSSSVFAALVRGCGQAYALQTGEPVTSRCGTRRVCQARSSGSERDTRARPHAVAPMNGVPEDSRRRSTCTGRTHSPRALAEGTQTPSSTVAVRAPSPS